MHVLVINSGSSTVKARFIETETRTLLGKGLADRVGTSECRLKWQSDSETVDESIENGTVGMAVERLIGLAQSEGGVQAVGHRIVHGGELFTRPTLIDDKVLEGIEFCARFAPLHNPAHAAGIKAARQTLPNVQHVAVFDTAFHATMPQYAHRYAIPEEYYREFGIRRYGAHGTSHQYLGGAANKYLEANGYDKPWRVVTLHLGNGASVAAVRDGICVDTSMGFTPLEGLVMGTRCGDMDPAVVSFLLEKKHWTAAEADKFMNKACGLLGVSGLSADMRDVERARSEGNEAARLAFDMFCYRIMKYVGSYTSVLGGLDALVFSGGIGENSQAVRRDVVGQLGWLGLQLDEKANEHPGHEATRISVADSGPVALVIPTDEEGLIAAQTAELVSQPLTAV